jgi:L,D-transpeptidase ErfK/SrfK
MKNMKIILALAVLLSSAAALAHEDTDLVYSQRPEAYGRSLCDQPGLHCVNVAPGDTWENKFPNAKQRDIIQRLNRTNISLKYRRWLVIPNSWQNLNFMDLGPFADKIDPTGGKLLLVDLRVFAFAAYDAEGRLLYWGPASGGDQWCSDSPLHCQTATGSFKIVRMKGADCVSNEYPVATSGGSHMPYCMYYYQGYALHAYTMTGFAHRSHGCIHLFYGDAKWLQEHFVELGTAIIVRR